jgi:hypothetical protein
MVQAYPYTLPGMRQSYTPGVERSLAQEEPSPDEA